VAPAGGALPPSLHPAATSAGATSEAPKRNPTQVRFCMGRRVYTCATSARVTILRRLRRKERASSSARGDKRFDVIGDTVNVAARLQRAGVGARREVHSRTVRPIPAFESTSGSRKSAESRGLTLGIPSEKDTSSEVFQMTRSRLLLG